MPSWKDSVLKIRELRDERMRCDEVLYRIQIQQRAAQSAVKRIRTKQTVLPENRLRIGELKRHIAAEEARLQRLEHSSRDDHESVEETRRIREELKRLRGELAELMRPREQNAGEAERAIVAMDARYKAAKDGLERSREGLQSAIAGLYGEAAPKDLVANLPDNTPFLLLPVRIETRFMTPSTSAELWLRIYPDDIAVHTHEAVLTDKEVSEGENYWTALWDARQAGGPGEEEAKKSAWNHVADLLGSQRSAWIARETKPTNWDDSIRARKPAFPHHDVTKTSSWSRAPRTHVMPDKFVVMLYEGDTLVKEVIGNAIPDELMVGPDPMEEEDAFVSKDGKLLFGGSFDWTSDFQKAVAVGMGFRIRLSAAQAANGFTRVVVLGLRLSADEADGKRSLEALISNHHYSPKGFSLVPQGTPTNNTDEGASGYTKNDQFNALSYYVETGDALFSEDDDTDGRNLADALGIDYEPLQYIRNSDGTDSREAVAMNTALYAGTLGYYFGTMMEPVLSDAAQDALRAFFVRRVTGRGPLPAVRVGNQPYGVLLTSDFGKWQWSRQELGLGARFLQLLYATLHKYHHIWLSALSHVDYVGKPETQADPSAVLMNVLGLQAGSVSFNQRIGYSTDYLRNRDAFQFGGRYWNDMQQHFTSKNRALNFLSALGYDERDQQGVLKVPQLLRLLYQHYDTPLDAANLIDGVPLSERALIRPYDEAAKKNYLHWLAEARSVGALETQDFGPGRSAPNTLLYLMARRALLLQLHQASVSWFHRNNIDLKSTLKAANFHNIRAQVDLTKWEALKARVAVASPDHPDKNKAVSEYLLTTGKNQSEAGFLNEVRDALKTLSQLPTARLERCFTEHLDVCTYRLDSWQTAIFGVRLENQRQQLASGQERERRTGIFLGAYGWLENVRPAGKRQVVREDVPEKLVPPKGEPLFEYANNGGFVHAPSLNQASAAAVLRSGYLSHAHSAQPDPLAVNLSSERIRRALFILQGVRNGQTLEALLGYQFERALHDAGSADDTLISLNEYIYDFRDRFPLEHHYLKQQGSDAPVESIPSNSVVNGVKLAEAAGDVPYGAGGPVTAATTAEKATIRKEKDRLADTLDAVKDLLQAESVYQMVQGNFDRAAAVINALQDTNVPPEIDVIDTPRSSHFTFTNRVTLQFAILDPNDPASNPWGTVLMTVRAKMEPGLNAWLAKVLGPPNVLFCRVAHLDADGNELGHAEVSIDKLAIQPIDLVYICGDELSTGASQAGKENKTSASELELRVAWHYRALQGLDDEAPVRIEFLKPDGKKTLGVLLPLVRMLKGTITDSRPLHARDFDPPSKQSLADPANPEGYYPDELLNRVEAIQLICENLLSAIHGFSIDAVVKDKDGNAQHFFTLEPTFDALKQANATFADSAFLFADVDAMLLQGKLIAAADMGRPDAFPHRRALDNAGKTLLLDQAMRVARSLRTALEHAITLLNDAAAATQTAKKMELRLAAAKALLGDVFNVLPRYTYNNETDIQLSHAARSQLLKHATNHLKMPYPAEEWLQNVAHVRPKTARWDSILSLYESFDGNRLALQPVQLPYRDHDSWLALEFPEKDALDPDQSFNIEHDTLSVTIHGDAAFTPASAQCGLLIDDWTEVIPTKTEITGIAFNYDQPNAAPPQALILAVTPQEKGRWMWDDLVGTLNDTLLRAKLRAVEPQALDKLDKAETGVLLPAILADFSQHDLNLALDYRTNIKYVQATVPIQSVGPLTNG